MSLNKTVMLVIALCFGLIFMGCEKQPVSYPIDSDVSTTLQKTIAFKPVVSGNSTRLSAISQYGKYGYGNWTPGPGLPSDPRTDIMPAGYTGAAVTNRVKLLNFFSITDIHITDKESPSQIIYLQQLYYPNLLPPPYNALGHVPWSWQTSVYSPVMLYTTQVLDAAVQTINALHKQKPFDFGVSLGDAANSTQYNELRWYIDVLDGKVITPSSGAHLGADTIDYQKPFKAAGLDKTIPWYQTLGNHDHFWIGSLPVNIFLRQSFISDTIMAAGDVLFNPINITNPVYYMGVLDGSTPNGDIKSAGPAVTFNNPPRVVPDPDRRSLLRTEWIKEFFTTSSNPVGHGLNLVDPNQEKGFACYSFVPKSSVPVKVIVLDDTQSETDGDTSIHGHGFLDQARWNWLKKELADGDAAGQLMIIAAHIPIGVQPDGSFMEWWTDPQNAVNITDLIAELHSHPNLLMWIAGHRHLNTVKAFLTDDPTRPERGFWQVETSSLRDFPQQFRTFEIYLNSDNTISIVTTDVDPAVKDGTPAATSRKYAVAAQQIAGNNLSPNNPASDPTSVGYPTAPDPTIKPMPTASYNAELVKQLTPEMQAKMRSYATPK
ncbi:MAG: TIGR03768 family metallophosphoesterase [Chloroflexi bacterium]|nr:TIGR03768 family metallophosphoesterase [Chloroflexota bacterium]